MNEVLSQVFIEFFAPIIHKYFISLRLLWPLFDDLTLPSWKQRGFLIFFFVILQELSFGPQFITLSRHETSSLLLPKFHILFVFLLYRDVPWQVHLLLSEVRHFWVPDIFEIPDPILTDRFLSVPLLTIISLQQCVVFQ